MPRTYIRRLGSRRYADYSVEKLGQCLADIKKGKLSRRKASERYNIPLTTLKNKVKSKHTGTIGRQTVFSPEEEDCFAHHMIKLSDYGFPIDVTDLRMFIKSYLDEKGRTEKRFKNNIPGIEFVRAFLKRNQSLVQRFSTNKVGARAKINEDVLREYIHNLHSELAGIPPSQIWNYDETNLTDDPGKKKVICRRGSKYVEQICNHSKTSTSVMFCGNADGSVFLPPYVVYKSDHLWTSWQTNGPPGTRYNRSRSGWFDLITFEDWFQFHFLPKTRTANGVSALIGDNLSSHISPHVINLCVTHNIKFICLLPNATSLCQPLDVAVYRPLKGFWRDILRDWKQSSEGRKNATLSKDRFPVLLNRLWCKLLPTIKANLVSGFKTTGIFPTDVTPLLEKLSSEKSTVDPALVGDLFLQQLEEKSGNASGISRVRRKKVNVPAGKGITPDDLSDDSDTSAVRNSSTEAESSSDEQASDDQSSDDQSSDDQSSSEEQTKKKNKKSSTENTQTPLFNGYQEGDYVIIIYSGDGRQYPGKITQINDDSALVKCMERNGKHGWRWPNMQDEFEYEWKFVHMKIKTPKPVSKRKNVYLVPELEDFIQ